MIYCIYDYIKLDRSAPPSIGLIQGGFKYQEVVYVINKRYPEQR